MTAFDFAGFFLCKKRHEIIENIKDGIVCSRPKKLKIKTRTETTSAGSINCIKGMASYLLCIGKRFSDWL